MQVLAALQAVGYIVQPLPEKVLRLAAAREAGGGVEEAYAGLVPLLPDEEVQELVERHIPDEKWQQLYVFQQEGVRYGLRRCAPAR